MKKEITCIKNRVKWIKAILENLKEVKKEHKIKELGEIHNDLMFNIQQIDFYAKKMEKKNEKK